ncbi:MAG: transpeptidase family protein [Prevotella sp.]|nr:transpeptidase family protein [Prevotella sp.]
MSKFDSEKVMPRYFIIAVVLSIIGVAILGKALYIMTAKKEYWTEVADRLKRDSVSVKPTRGNILSCDGQLMASSIPEFKMYMDFQASAFENDTLWNEKLDSVCQGLNDIFPQKSAEEFKKHLEEGRKKIQKNGKVGARHWPIWPYRVNYDTYTEVKSLPFFSMPKFKSGFHEEEYNARRRPFGSLAQRTVGDMFGAKDTARCGLELSYDSILRGTNGIVNRRKVLDKYRNITVLPPIDGADIVTTIDVNMQDLAEKAVIDELKLIGGDLGVAILMEVKTGDIKAIVNMTRCADGEYREVKNNAVADLREPGSVFKTASFLVALDDGVVDTTYRIETGSGVYHMHGRDMKDHNWRNGGYHNISLPRALEVSSNIGVSRVIDEHYGNNPEKFVEGLYRIGIASDLHIPLVGATAPRIRKPRKNKRGQYENWSKTALPWMSIGYETQIPPISTVTFYNAIANDGRMMRPRFVKKIVKDGETVMEFPPEVIKEHIAKPQTIKTMQTILEHVVSQGLGKKAGSRAFKVAGKTGTAQIAEGGGYKTGTMKYWLSFAGFFPADKPLYSCIVCLKKSGLPASGGGMSGVVFHHISEGVMARYLKLSVEDAHDSTSVVIPDVKNGDLQAAHFVLNQLGIKTNSGWNGDIATGAPIWGSTTRNAKDVTMYPFKVQNNIMPNVTGMGARDAVFLLESKGLKVKLHGRGKVTNQSIAYGNSIKAGSTCSLTLN